MRLEPVCRLVTIEQIEEGQPLREVLRIGPPEDIRSIDYMVVMRFVDERFGYYPVVHTIHGRDAAWVWDCFRGQLNYIAGGAVASTVPVASAQGKIMCLSQIVMKDRRALCKFTEYHFDDYRSYQVVAADANAAGKPAVRLSEGENDGPDLRELDFDRLFD